MRPSGPIQPARPPAKASCRNSAAKDSASSGIVWPWPGQSRQSAGDPVSPSAASAANRAWAGTRSSRSPWQSRTGGRLWISEASRSGAASRPEKPTTAPSASGRRGPTCSDIMVPWLNPTKAQAEAGRRWRASSASMNASSVRRGGLDAGRQALQVHARERKPLVGGAGKAPAWARARWGRQRRLPAMPEPGKAPDRSGHRRWSRSHERR